MAEIQAAEAVHRRAMEAGSLADAMPRLVLEARRVALTIAHGLHGRRRAGQGETFWQYRRFVSGEPARFVDWRRSARDDHLYVREREWEAAHTVWIWPDRSRSMHFASRGMRVTKRDRAIVLAMALAEVLVAAGERIAIPGIMRPTANRRIIELMAERLIATDGKAVPSLPPGTPILALSEAVIIGDLLSPAEEIAATVGGMSGSGARGHLLQVLDPIEETFPFSGRAEFVDPESGLVVDARRADAWRADYAAVLSRHRAAVKASADRVGWSFAIHRTDRPATETLLALALRVTASRTPAMAAGG